MDDRLTRLDQHTFYLDIRGMTCQGCAGKVQKALQELAPKSRPKVDLEAGKALLRPHIDDNLTAEEVIDCVNNLGFHATEATGSAPKKRFQWLQGWQFNVWIGGATTLFFAVAHWVLDLHSEPYFPWLAWALATPVQILCGSRFYVGAWHQARSWQANMDTLVALGSTSAYFLSIWYLLTNRSSHLYFMEAAGIITFVSIGHALEQRTSRQTSFALKRLLTLQPKYARRIQTGSVVEVPVDELSPGDQIEVASGEQIPSDCVLADGWTTVDESMLTGESKPIDKQPGSTLLAGTINLTHPAVATVTTPQDASSLANIIAMVESAQSSKAQLQKLGDKVASYFVPMVVLVAALVGVAWYVSSPQPNSIKLETAIVNAIAVLVVACPCAMGLATPIAIVAGTNAAARRGILISHGQALEASGEIDIVAFDKTGTLTVGKPQVRKALKDVNLAEEAGSIAHALAQKSKHPLSLAIAAYESQSEPDTLESIHETAGQGLEGRRINGSETVQMGALEWLEANGVSALDDGQGFLKKIETIKQSGWQLVGLATGQRLIAVYVLEDSLKEEADNLVKTFAKLEIECLMLSGDREEAVLHANRKLGFAANNVYANCLPSDKARVIQAFQEKGLKVAFVGDGINDAPSLAQADLGIAVAAASDIAKATADIHLINSDIQTIPKAITLARQTLRTIKQNLFWAFFYNVAAIPLAALGFLNPMVCAATMGLSDLVVVINSIRLAKR